jgi:hypothetical protein
MVHAALIACGALILDGCAIADSRSPVPEFMRDSVFVASSYPRQVRVSPPRGDLHGPGWTACVQAELTSATGRPLGTQTYRITISGGVIIDRRRVEAGDICASESYEPI